ncbi:unnamed protein product [Calypogeia fissa]
MPALNKDQASADLAAARSEMLDEVPPATYYVAPPASNDGVEESTPHVTRISFSGTTEQPNPSKILSGRKWSSRLLGGLSRKDSLEYDASRVKGVTITHASYGSRKLPWSLTLTLAYQTIGVVYGDLGTSPLYVFAAIFSDRIPTKTEVYGSLSIILYTFTLLPLIKYVFIVLRANDNGNGGTFALYSLLCRHAKILVSQNQGPEDSEVSSYNLPTPSRPLKRSNRMKEALQKSPFLRNGLLTIAVLGTCMVIGDGVLTPSISVLSAIQGIKTAVPSVSQTIVVIITCVILVLLFCLQRFGPDKVGYLFSPIVLTWFFSIGVIGLYNIVKHDPSVFRAFNPWYIILFFKTDKYRAWVSLGGAVLCITGTEAMFADLGHFSVRAIQVAFTSIVYPCLLLAYIGQAAYLTVNPGDVAETFFKSIPKPVYWPMFAVSTGAAIIASQAMISATFAIVYQAMTLGCFPRVRVVHTSKKYPGQIYIPEMNWLLMILCVAIAAGFQNTNQIGNAYGVAVNADMIITTNLLTLVMLMIWQTPLYLALGFWCCLSSVELLYFSSVLNKIPQGGWVPVVFVVIFSMIMYTWHYGRVKKYSYEVHHKVSMDWVLRLGSNLGMARVPGIGLVYTELAQGVPTIFTHLINNLPAMHAILVFVCIKYLPLPNVPDEERFLVRRLGPKQYRMYRCAVRFGYMDVMENEDKFENLLIQCLSDFIKNEMSPSDSKADGRFDGKYDGKFDGKDFAVPHDSRIQIEEVPNSTTMVPMNLVEASKQLPKRFDSQSSLDGISNMQLSTNVDSSLEDELNMLETSRQAGIVYLLGRTEIKASKESSALKKFVIDAAYNFLQRNSRSSIVYLNIPYSKLLQVGMIHNI